MQELGQKLMASAIDILIYSGIALAFILGIGKCVITLRRLARHFRRATRRLESYIPSEGARPVWQDTQFLGKPMEKQWKHFLMNAEQLDQRGLACDVGDYINDQSVFPDYAHLQLSEVIPGMLTSFGILGTFIGLLRGLGNLDVTSAENTMSSISRMIGGMTFAYGTSIAGLVCSLLFNLFFRMAQGAATRDMDRFLDAFNGLIMQRPLDPEVRSTCYMEDQAAFLLKSSDELHQKLGDGITNAIESAFMPVNREITAFIRSETQAQVEGINRMVGHFIDRMNASLNGQFVQLGRTLSAINQSQSVSLEAVNNAMAASHNILGSIEQTDALSRAVMERFERYVREIGAAQAGSAQTAKQINEVLNAMQDETERQGARYQALREAQDGLQDQMRQYALWSGRVLEAVENQSDKAAERTQEVAEQVERSSRLLSDSYTGFVENISSGLARTMGLFEENLRDMMDQMMKQTLSAPKTEDKDRELLPLSRTQQALSDMTQALNRATRALAALEKGNTHAEEA